MKEDLERWVDTVKKLFYHSQKFTIFVCAMIVVLFIAFPRFMLWVLVTTLIFIFVKGFILILKMINNR